MRVALTLTNIISDVYMNFYSESYPSLKDIFLVVLEFGFSLIFQIRLAFVTYIEESLKFIYTFNYFELIKKI